MSIFDERQKNEAITQAIKEKLRGAGLSHMPFKLYFKTGGKFDIVFEGASEADVKRVSDVLGAQATVISKSSGGGIGDEISTLDIESEHAIDTTPRVRSKDSPPAD